MSEDLMGFAELEDLLHDLAQASGEFGTADTYKETWNAALKEMFKMHDMITALRSQLAQLEAILSDPVAVRLNIHLGRIAQPADMVFMDDETGPVADLRAELAATIADGDVMSARLRELEAENIRLRADNACLRIANEIARPPEIDELRAENARLRAALEADKVGEIESCECGGELLFFDEPHFIHKPGCSRQLALHPTIQEK